MQFSLARGLDRKADVVLVEPRDLLLPQRGRHARHRRARLFDRIAIP